MTRLGPALADYLSMRRALGYKLQRTEKLLADLIRYVEAASVDQITIDIAVAWGPLAGYFAKGSRVPLELRPVTPPRDGPLQYVFDIAMGVRRRDSARVAVLDSEIQRRRPEIERILHDYGVPLVPR